MATDEERRRLKAEYKDQERAKLRRLLVLDEKQLNALLDHLEESGADEICDDTPRLTTAWAERNGLDADAVTASLAELGGHCDCEVLANVDPEEIF